MRQSFLVAAAFCLVFSAGCRKEEPAAAPTTVVAPRAAVRLTLLVVDDPEIAAGAKLLRGEWAERSGGELAVEEMSLDEFNAAQQLTADVVIYPSRLVGTLVARDWLRPVRESVLHDDSFVFDDLLPLVRNQVMRYGGQVYSVSLGESPLIVAWQGDGEAPDTWPKFNKRSPSNDDEQQFTAELVERAACYIDARYRAELLFDPANLTPRLTSPPVVRALEEIVSRSKRAATPDAGLQVTWPTSAGLVGEQWQLAAVPRAAQVFDMLRQDWESQSNIAPLTVLGFAGRSASVTASSRNATSAFKLLGWLTSGETAAQLSSRSHATIWFRNSQSMRAERWLHGRGGVEAAGIITRSLSSEDCFMLPRIPGIDQYLAALNDAVGQSVRGDLAPAAALESATKAWESLTEGLGRDQQLLAYRRHLGLVATGE